MAEQMAQDPNFQAMTQQLAGMGLGGMAPPAAAGDDGAPAAEPREADAAGEDASSSAPPAGMPNINPEQYMKVRIQIVQDTARSMSPAYWLQTPKA